MAATRCDSPNTLRREVEALRPALTLVESEESWDIIAKGIVRFTYLCKNGACDFSAELITSIRTFSRPLSNAMCSERSRLSGAAIDLLCALASDLGAEFEPLLSLFFPTLLTLCTRTNKVIITRARTCILAVIEHTQLPAILPYLLEASKDKSASLRVTAAESVLACLNCFNPPDLEKEVRARLVEDVIRATARDASADVRKISRKVFEAYKALLPGRVDKFVAPLTPVMKKYLDIHVKPPAPTNNCRPQTHMRSASSSVLCVTGQSKSSGVTIAQSDDGGAMPPPNYIPVRRGPPAWPPITTSRSASSVEDKMRTRSALSTGSGGSGPSRPPSATAIAPPKAVDKPSRFPAPSIVARRVGHPITASVPAKASSGGASRLNRVAKDPTTGEGPIRPVVGDAESKTRVMGGARRVPLPPSAIKGVEDESVKMTAGNVHSTSESTTKVVQSATLSRSTVSRSAPSETKTNEKPKPVPRPITKQSSTTALSSSTLSKVHANPSRSDTKEVQKQDVRAAGTMQPTLAQLSRAKAAAIDRKGKNAVKPGWGRPAPSKVAAGTRGASVEARVHDTKPVSLPNPKGKVTPKDIPLPSSPKREKTPTSVPLPQSPKEMEAREPLKVEEGPASIMEENRHVEVTTGTPVPTVPFMPDDQEPADSTPTQKSLGAPAGTPISTLLTSIQQGFLFTPCSPLSPPQTYIPLTVDGDAEIDSPTPTFFTRPGEAQLPGGYLTRDHLATKASDDVGQRIPQLMPALEDAKTPPGGDEIKRQVLSNVEVN